MESRQYLTFELSGLELGIDIREVTRIVEHVAATRVPHLPEVIRGVVNLGGTVIPVVDLARKLSLTPRAPTRRTCLVVVETAAAGSLALVVDAVHDVVDVARDDLLPAPDFGVQIRPEYLLGIAKWGDRLVLVIDSQRVLSPAELVAVAEAADAPAAVASP